MALTVLRNGSGEVLTDASGVAFVVNAASLFVRDAVSSQLRTTGTTAGGTVTFTSVVAGQMLVLWAANYPSGVSTVTDDKGNSWSRAVAVGDGGDNFGEVWWCQNAAAGTTVVTITPTATSDNYVSARGRSYTVPAGATVVLDQTGINNNGATSTTTTVTTSGATVDADELLAGVFVVDGTTTNADFTVPTDWSQVDVEQNSDGFTGYHAIDSFSLAAGTQTVTSSHAGVSFADGAMATFRLTFPSSVTSTPGAGTANITGQTPAAVVDTIMQPGAGTVAITGQLPLADVTRNVVIAVEEGALRLAGQTPTADVTRNALFDVPAGAVTISGAAPTIAATDSFEIPVDAGAVTITGEQPAVMSGGDMVAQPAAGTVVIDGQAPTITATDDHLVQPDAGNILLSGEAPTLLVDAIVQPDAGSILLSGEAPAVTVTDNVSIEVPDGAIVIDGYAPTLAGAVTSDVPAGAITIEGLAPTIINTDSGGDIADDPKYMGGNVKFRPLRKPKQPEPQPMLPPDVTNMPDGPPIPRRRFSLMQSLLEVPDTPAPAPAPIVTAPATKPSAPKVIVAPKAPNPPAAVLPTPEPAPMTPSAPAAPAVDMDALLEAVSHMVEAQTAPLHARIAELEDQAETERAEREAEAIHQRIRTRIEENERRAKEIVTKFITNR